MGRRGQSKDTLELCRAYHLSPEHKPNLNRGYLDNRICLTTKENKKYMKYDLCSNISVKYRRND